MVWFKVDDKLHDHRKARTASVPALGLWVLAGSWSADNLTDGFVPETVCSRWTRDYRKLADRLVAAGLWRATTKEGEPGWRFHEWSDHQPTKQQVEADRKANRERLQRWRERRHTDDPGNGVTNGVSNGASNGNPDPTRPDPTRPLSNHLDLEGGSNASRESKKPPSEFCKKHPNGTDAPCGACGRARRAVEAWHDARAKDAANEAAERQALIAACSLCDDKGITEEPPHRHCAHEGTTP